MSVNAHANISLAPTMRRIVLLAAVVLLAGCKPQPRANVFVDPALASLVPADTVFLAGVRMGRLAETEFYRRYVATSKLGLAQKFHRETGLDPAKDLWEFLIASDAKDTVVLVRGRFSEHGLEPRLEREGAQRFSYKGYTMIGDDRSAVVFLNPTTGAAGSSEVLRRLIDNRQNVTGLPKALEQRIDKLPSEYQAWFAAEIAGHVPEAKGSGVMANLHQLLRSVQYASGGADLRQSLKAHASFECVSENDAERLRSTIAGLLGLGRLNTPEENRESLDVFDEMRVSRERTSVRFSTDIAFDALEKSPILAPLFDNWNR
jgi:hypothetical protein